MEDFPLIAKSIWDYSPESFRTYVKSIRESYRALEEKRKARKLATAGKKPNLAQFTGLNLRINAKGTPVITIKRKPKYILKYEIEQIAKNAAIKQNIIWRILRKRKIDILDLEPK